ncbi:mono/diheme cytochrome c family protein [Natronospira proteinivora]|uniref:Mono/diheme cytochrome c family protein n=1 Tax=Natronospira proteinivora TaxID=1807133 RepID=A0ABT1G8S9_9GAMM|nr:cytochrome c [Natronospira proteinivora]MCP1727712.1 mono/diheme cytochrome c family protein [Natronospira proteinivora]
MTFLLACDQQQEELEATVDEAIEESPYPQGAALYERQCRACHQMDGSGHGRAFPPLADHVPKLLKAEGGREYLIQLTLYGLGGEIQVLGEQYSGVMPGFRRMSDEQVAALLNHVSYAWEGKDQLPEDFEPYEAEDVARQREERLSPSQVWERRPEL